MNLTLTLAAGCLIAVGATAIADELEVREPESVAEDLTPDVGSVIQGRVLLQRALRDRYDREVGMVEDLIIDPYYARVASLVIRPNAKIDRERRLVVPVELVAPLTSKYLRASVIASEIEKSATSLTKNGSQPYTRTLSLATFRHYDLKPYWKENDRDSTDRQDKFVMLTELRKQIVSTPAGEKLGRVDDVMVSEKDGKIMYTLFEHNHEENGKAKTRTYPIPLAAFVVPPKSDDWMLELDEAILDNTEIVQGTAFPKEVARGWVEYIHVRYGGGVFDGIQRSLKTVK